MAQEQSVRDEHYDLISALYHLTEGDWTYSQYILDAKHANDEELAALFREAQEQHQRLAARAKALLLERLGDAQGERKEEGDYVAK